MSMDYSTIRVSLVDGLATLELARPERKNAINAQMFSELGAALQTLRLDSEVRSLLLTGAGDAFCSGADIANLGASADSHAQRQRMQEYNRVLAALANFDRPVIAAVDGVAFGAGFSLALAADFVIASDRARFCMAFARVGLVPDLGATYSLPRLVGIPKAREILYSARELGAAEALAIGIVFEVVPPEQVRARAEQLLRSLQQQSATAFALTKQLLAGELSSHLEREACAQTLALQSRYPAEAAARFARKEPALFQWPPSPRSQP